MSDVRDILAENIRFLMSQSTHCKTQNATAKYAKERGFGRVKQTTLGTLLRPPGNRGATYPKLDTIEAIAELFSVPISALLSKHLGQARSSNTTNLFAREDAPLAYIATDPVVEEIIQCLDSTDKTGRAIVRDKARDIAHEYPLNKAKPVSST
jgi:hypothetical protein